MPNYGPTGRSSDTVAEWLLGDRKWRLLTVLARRPGRAFRVDQLATRAGCAEPTAYEFLRALRPTNAIRRTDASYALDPENDLADALIALTRALSGRRELLDKPSRLQH